MVCRVTPDRCMITRILIGALLGLGLLATSAIYHKYILFRRKHTQARSC